MSHFPRVIPVLTFRDRLLVKPLCFGEEKYIGDPVNAVRIFNEKQVDEIVLVDLDASEKPGSVDFDFVAEIASEAFMPVGYGGGINSVSIARQLTSLGIEKVIINTAFSPSSRVVTEISNEIGSQSTVASIDTRKKRFGGYDTLSHRASRSLGVPPLELAREAVAQGAGEILLHSTNRERTFQGYDLQLLREVCAGVTVPVIALGGARGLNDFADGIAAGASAVAAGSAFVLQGKHQAVLITYPRQDEIRSLAGKN